PGPGIDDGTDPCRSAVAGARRVLRPGSVPSSIPGPGGLERREATLADQLLQERKLRVARRDLDDVTERAGNIFEIGRLAIPVVEPCENAGRLELALGTHEFEAPHELWHAGRHETTLLQGRIK